MKPENRTPEIASAKGRVKPLARLLRYATALRVTPPHLLRLKALVWPKGTFRPVYGPNPPQTPRERIL